MENRNKQKLAEIRSLFFSCLEAGEEAFDYNHSIRQLLTHIQKWLGVSVAVYYTYQETRIQMVPVQSSAGGPDKSAVLPISCSARDYKRLTGAYGIPASQLAMPDEYQFIIPLREDGHVSGILAFGGPTTDLLNMEEECLKMISRECSRFLRMIGRLSRVAVQEKRYKQLYRVTEKFHSSMNMNDVLGEIIHTLREVYPEFTYYLLMSHDNHHDEGLPIKDLEYNSENIAAMQAYVNSTVQFEDSLAEQSSIFYAPLKGKQGVYGVLQVISEKTSMFPKSEVEFITLLANTAGSAIENAQLYQQSKRLIADLQLINETSHRLNSNLRLNETMNYMKEQISKSFNAEEIGFVLYSSDQEWKVVPGSSNFFSKPGSLKYLSYVKEKIEQEKESLFLGDMRLANGEPAAFRSIMAVPMVQSGSIKGFAVVMHRDTYHFTFDMFKLLQSLIHHSTLAFTNSILREELERMVVMDHVTQLYSRNYLDEKLLESMKTEDQGVFILMDIDNFKTINDTYGHQIGDEVLVQVSNIIMASIRSTDIAARWGGEELAIYLPKVNLETGYKITDRIRQKVEKETSPMVSVSCGVSYWYSQQKDHVHALFKRADTALYEAKNTGKNRVILQA
ncbi:diguanylate cyclase domain-containing protein [Bacillus testis]|uniref:diguanylate cyclase domain-containing protein n=1 Tax=Bacillus testis TaxID=1622072 RepID=UPI00067F6D02|nr:diguanylate cyclase [Bacillus testis]